MQFVANCKLKIFWLFVNRQFYLILIFSKIMGNSFDEYERDYLKRLGHSEEELEEFDFVILGLMRNGIRKSNTIYKRLDKDGKLGMMKMYNHFKKLMELGYIKTETEGGWVERNTNPTVVLEKKGEDLVEKKILELEFPSDYGKSELAGKPVNFETEVNEVLAPKLPNLDSEFFKSTGIEAENVESFKKEVRTKLEEDLVNIVNGKVKQSLYDALLEANEFEVPLAMVDSEVSNMKQDTARRMGMDPKDLKEDLFPDDMFKEEATKRVKVGILLNKIIEEKELKPDADKVKEIIEERAKNYKDPQQVINYFYSDDEQLRNIESISLEEQVVDALKLEAKSSDENISYEDCVSGTYG